ncbi:hypothetical protein [Rubinisphaera margarita]|uniref:hypothetical protein n=1 Tax=Rubinisphaera margarita TaxID=2909586 RepID=UPI001EE839AD|nr:hypothetical protein [Rubinisphaera margarita]MCG6158290.1 hypothetical protein [Rubinisphaera margarita]
MAAPSSLTPTSQGQSLPWLFSPLVDLCTFLGSAAIALGLLVVGAQFGLLHDDTPEWMWVPAILMIDVAHVYATGFRVYFDRAELRRNPWLYSLAPLLGFLIGAAIYSESSIWFWRILAYLAVFHFVRQQYGWVALYRARGGETGRVGYWIDTSAIYLATVYPLVYWHAASPRNFNWFLEGDFLSLPAITASLFQVLYWIALGSYVFRAIYRGVVKREFNPGKDIVVATTALCWYLGIVALNSDYAFTVTNVIIHGIPYLVLVFWYRWMRQPEAGSSRWSALFSFLGIVWMLAYFEELLWDTGLWHERPWLFGTVLNLEAWEPFLIPLLAVPQITHYILDGFIWKRRSNKDLASMVDH